LKRKTKWIILLLILSEKRMKRKKKSNDMTIESFNSKHKHLGRGSCCSSSKRALEDFENLRLTDELLRSEEECLEARSDLCKV